MLPREADAWIRTDRIGDVALPFYEGRMIGQFEFNQKGWVSGKGRGALWKDISNKENQVEPQYLMSLGDYQEGVDARENLKVAIMDITSSTNTRTMIAALLGSVPCGHSLGVLECSAGHSHLLAATLNSFVFDWALRARFSGLHASWFVIEDAPLPPQRAISETTALTTKLREWVAGLVGDVSPTLASPPIRLQHSLSSAITHHERLRLRILIDVLIATILKVGPRDLQTILTSGHSHPERSNPKGFGRVDQGKPLPLSLIHI